MLSWDSRHNNAAGSVGSPTATTKSADPNASLPDIHYFQAHPTDQFIVNYDVIGSGHPYKGKGAVTPHYGGHVNFEKMYQNWPQGGAAPSNYPPIYAVADGVAGRITKSFRVGNNDRYGINIIIAKDGDANWEFEYSIEPMLPEPSPDFYLPFMLVKEGNSVKKGQVIGYMYLPHTDNNSHIHFELINTKTQQFAAPAIFTPVVVKAFYDHWANQGFDSDGGRANPIPICMGWKLAAEENPFSTGALDCL